MRQIKSCIFCQILNPDNIFVKTEVDAPIPRTKLMQTLFIMKQ